MLGRFATWTGIVRERGMLRLALAAVVGLVMMGASTGVAAAEGGEYGDLSGQAWQILAPGAEGGLIPGEYSFDQAAIYNSLTPHEGRVTEKSLSKYYLSEKFGVPQAATRSSPRVRVWKSGATPTTSPISSAQPATTRCSARARSPPRTAACC